jgi:regulator of protease activity HflC (stomatin/prohibitin superfamily)
MDGKLEVLQPNTYMFDTSSRIFTCFLSTQQLTQPLTDDNQDIIHCDTKDFVEVGIRASVFYRVADAARAITMVGTKEKIQELIRETSIATL